MAIPFFSTKTVNLRSNKKHLHDPHMSLRETAATVSSILDHNQIPCILWGNLLLTTWGIPSISDPRNIFTNNIQQYDISKGVSFVVPDHNLQHATTALLNTGGFARCPSPDECLAFAKSRGWPVPAAHVHGEQDTLVSLFEQSRSLPRVASLQLDTNSVVKNSDVILASSPRLPAARPGRGQGRFPTSLYPVRVPAAHCLLEAYIDLIERYRFHKHKFYYMAMFGYIIDYVVRDGLIDMDCLQPRYRKIADDYMIGQIGFTELLRKHCEGREGLSRRALAEAF